MNPFCPSGGAKWDIPMGHNGTRIPFWIRHWKRAGIASLVLGFNFVYIELWAIILELCPIAGIAVVERPREAFRALHRHPFPPPPMASGSERFS